MKTTLSNKLKPKSQSISQKIESIAEEMNKALIDWIPPWWVIQNNEQDKKTNFIYKIDTYDDLLDRIRKEYSNNLKTSNANTFFDGKDGPYAINRWFNHMWATLAESVFLEFENVKKEPDIKNHDIDIWVMNSQWEYTPFDVKWSVFPKKYEWDWSDNDLLQWLIDNASKQWRKHIDNRIFIVFKALDWEHKKLKADLPLIRENVKEFMESKKIKKVPIILDTWEKKDILCWIIKVYQT